MADIFISYARADRDKVEPIAKALEAKGWSVWWDARIRSGESFDRVIEKALTAARCVVAAWSANSVESDWVRAEASYALDQGILISVAIEQHVKPPLRFWNIHTESLIDWDGKEPSSSFEKILSDIELVLGPQKLLEEANVSEHEDRKSQDDLAVRPPTKFDQKHKAHPEIGAMVEVPAGEFIYQDWKVTIEKPYRIGAYPVTNQQYEKFINADGYKNDEYWSKSGRVWLKKEKIAEPRYWLDEKWTQPNYPVVGVSYFEAQAYAKWTGERLPTNEEWERAARGTNGQKYPWGNEFEQERCNTDESGIGQTTSVTQYPNGISQVGCYDMAGNVWEWTSSWYDDKKESRVLRGGSWYFDQIDAQCTFRLNLHPHDRYTYIGFRCVKDI